MTVDAVSVAAGGDPRSGGLPTGCRDTRAVVIHGWPPRRPARSVRPSDASHMHLNRGGVNGKRWWAEVLTLMGNNLRLSEIGKIKMYKMSTCVRTACVFCKRNNKYKI